MSVHIINMQFSISDIKIIFKLSAPNSYFQNTEIKSKMRIGTLNSIHNNHFSRLVWGWVDGAIR